MKIRIIRGIFLFLGVFFLWFHPVQATETAGAASATVTDVKKKKLTETVVILDNLGRDTPRGAISGFLSAAKARNYERAAQYLDLRDRLPERVSSEGPQLAKSLRIVLEQKFLVNLKTVSDAPEGKTEDGLPSDQENIGQIEAPGETFALLLERVSQEGTASAWKISRETVNEIPEMSRRLGFGFLGKFMPAIFFEFSFFNITLAEWIFFFVLFSVGTLFSWLVLRLLSLLAAKFSNKYFSDLVDHVRWPLLALLSVSLLRSGLEVAVFSAVLQDILQKKTAAYLFWVWFLLQLIDFFILQIGVKLKQRGTPESANLVKFIGKIIKTVVVLAGLTLWLENIGVRISALLAGIGIGGIAFALAAQKSIEDFFGAITIIGYRPLKLGETIRFGENMGMVIDIGVRYTRIRTMDRTVLNVPNGQLASMPIENLSRRDKFRYLNVIDLGYETTRDQLRYILMELRTLLYSDDRISGDPACWARFMAFGEYSLKVEISAWIRTNDVLKYREIAEDLNFKIMKIVAGAGANFAFPTQVQYEQENAPVNQELVQKAEEQVKKWKAEGKLFIDVFPPEEIARLRQRHKK